MTVVNSKNIILYNFCLKFCSKIPKRSKDTPGLHTGILYFNGRLGKTYGTAVRTPGGKYTNPRLLPAVFAGQGSCSSNTPTLSPPAAGSSPVYLHL